MHTDWQTCGDIPGSTARNAALQQRAPGELNFSLLLHRFLPQPLGGDKSPLAELLAKASRQSAQANGHLLDAAREQSLKAVGSADGAARRLTFHLRERMTIGFGLPSPTETGLRLQHLLGTPLIPSSALKGLARAQARQELAERFGVPFVEGVAAERTAIDVFDDLLGWALPPDDDAALAALSDLAHLLGELGHHPKIGTPAGVLQGLVRDLDDYREAGQAYFRTPRDQRDPDGLAVYQQYIQEQYGEVHRFRRAFGSRWVRGSVTFSDAWPERLRGLEQDLLNPHYGRYYEDPTRVSPADYHDPIPTFFLTVPSGTAFSCALGVMAADADTGAAREQVVEWLRAGLRDWGIGAKTAVGYGAAEVTGLGWV